MHALKLYVHAAKTEQLLRIILALIHFDFVSCSDLGILITLLLYLYFRLIYNLTHRRTFTSKV